MLYDLFVVVVVVFVFVVVFVVFVVFVVESGSPTKNDQNLLKKATCQSINLKGFKQDLI
jgi:uncharacterized membrane protein YhaH (DUF805 family)